jgi:hypothetical protein
MKEEDHDLRQNVPAQPEDRDVVHDLDRDAGLWVGSNLGEVGVWLVFPLVQHFKEAVGQPPVLDEVRLKGLPGRNGARTGGPNDRVAMMLDHVLAAFVVLVHVSRQQW